MRPGNWGFRRRDSRAPARWALIALIATGTGLFTPRVMRAEMNDEVRMHTWILEQGFTTLALDKDSLSSLNLRTSAHRGEYGEKAAAHDGRVLTLSAEPGSTLTVEEGRDEILIIGAALRHVGALQFAAGEARSRIEDMVIADDGLPIGDLNARSAQDRFSSGLLFRGVHVDVDVASREVVLATDTVTLSPAMATALGVPDHLQQSLGTLLFRGYFRKQLVEEASVSSSESLLDFDHSRRVVAGGSVGPDVIVFALPSIGNYGSEIDPDTQERISAFSVGTTSCNIGDEPATWIPDINQHPVIAQNLYRLKDDRFEQIGLSWAKHGFFAVTGSQCSACTPPPGITGQWLGVGCSDPYGANLNGDQSNLGPRSPVNPFTGLFPYPFNRTHVDDNIDRRLQVKTVDIDPTLNGMALYFVEGHYVTPDDAQAGNHFNNVSYRRAFPARPSLGNNFCINPTLDPVNDVCLFTTSSTHEQQSALNAWKAADDTVEFSEAFVPGEGKFELGAKVIDLQDGFYRYEYALFNMNSDRCAGSFRVPIPEGAAVRNMGFRAPFHHSGEPYDGAPWTATRDTDAVIWSTTSYQTNENANAIRWGTLYNFWLEASAEPEPAFATIGLFKPGTPAVVTVSTLGGGGLQDCNGNSVPDTCDISCSFPGCSDPCGGSDDCNDNNLPDECEPDCNSNGIADECDIRDLTSNDCDENGTPDECDPDCDSDGTPDSCEVDLDADDDGVNDCDDLCPETTPPGLCLCPELDTCCFDNGFCIPGYPRVTCLAQSGTPNCQTSPCRDGCLVGDWDVDGDLDLYDMSMLMECFDGYDVEPSSECALRFDFDREQDVDVDDFRRFRSDYTGPQ